MRAWRRVGLRTATGVWEGDIDAALNFAEARSREELRAHVRKDVSDKLDHGTPVRRN